MDGGRASKQKVVLGTHTSDGEQNYLMLAEVLLPTQDSETDATGYDEESHEVGGYGAAAGKVQVMHQPRNEVILRASPLSLLLKPLMLDSPRMWSGKSLL